MYLHCNVPTVLKQNVRIIEMHLHVCGHRTILVNICLLNSGTHSPRSMQDQINGNMMQLEPKYCFQLFEKLQSEK